MIIGTGTSLGVDLVKEADPGFTKQQEQFPAKEERFMAVKQDTHRGRYSIYNVTYAESLIKIIKSANGNILYVRISSTTKWQKFFINTWREKWRDLRQKSTLLKSQTGFLLVLREWDYLC